MVLDSAENHCLLAVLRLLDKREMRYALMFKETKVSHTTLQNVLKDLIEKSFISKLEEGYEITEKGKKLLRKLEELEKILE